MLATSKMSGQKYMTTGKGINTVKIGDQVVHISDLSFDQLCVQWAKRQRELNTLYEANRKAKSGWRGLVLSLMGIHLPDRTNDSLYSHLSELETD